VPDQPLKTLLRLIGSFSLLALIFVFVPYESMDSIHRSLGMGPLPDQPVVGYLARSTSAFYALVGGLLWLVSFDPRRYRRVLIYLGFALSAFGIALVWIDWSEGMPMFWKVWEGPFVLVFGIAISILSRKIAPH
jgi:hypothetical protein